MSFPCRHCGNSVEFSLVDLGYSPPSNAYIAQEELREPEMHFPLRVGVCESCWLVQTEDFTNRELLFAKDYAYFSSTSNSWLEHARRFADFATAEFGLSRDSFVVEVGSNDGYLLQYIERAGIPHLGVEPTASTAQAARAKGIEVLEQFFGLETARQVIRERGKADLFIANNVYAHVPDINDFTRGVAEVLSDDGVAVLEFPHLLELIRHCQFDTIYHEHFSYLSLLAVEHIFMASGLRVFDVEHLSTHGGSLRVYGCLQGATRKVHSRVDDLRASELAASLNHRDGYGGFQRQVDGRKNAFLRFLIDARKKGRSVAGYGAAAKGNTLLNYAGVRPDLLPFVCDAAEAKQGKFLPGSHIPIKPPEYLDQNRPDFVVIFPWNIADEIRRQLAHLGEAGTQFVKANFSED